MTSNADFKRRVRERMARTGESYTAARAQLLRRTTLHVTNGDSAAQGIAGTGLPGRILPWRHVLHDGPLGDFTESYRVLDGTRATSCCGSRPTCTTSSSWRRCWRASPDAG